MVHVDPPRPHQRAERAHREHGGETRVERAVAEHHQRRLGHREAEDDTGDDAGERAERVLAEHERAHRRNDDPDGGRTCLSHGPKGTLRPMPDAAASDWTVKAADTIDAVVTVVHDKAVVPVTTIARWLVYGLLAAIVGMMALVLTAIALVRVLDIVTGDGRVWIAHLITGGIFTLAGLFAWSKRSPRE